MKIFCGKITPEERKRMTYCSHKTVLGDEGHSQERQSFHRKAGDTVE